MGEVIILNPLPRAIEIRAHIYSLEKRSRWQARRLPIGKGNYQRHRNKAHIADKAKFTKESERLSGIAKRVTWDVTTKAVQMHSQLHSIQEEISILESSLISRETRWRSTTRMVQLQNELHKAQEKISSLEWSLKDKGMMTSFEAELI